MKQRLPRTRLLCLAAILVLAPPACAHPALDQEVVLASLAISREPARADLYLVRAHLHRLHHDWAAARSDISAAITLGADPGDAAGASASLWLDQGFPALAVNTLAESDGSPEALQLRAHAFRLLGLRRNAAQDLESALNKSSKQKPDNVLELCVVIESCPERGPTEVLRQIDRAQARLGLVPGLVRRAVETERHLGRLAPCLARLEMLTDAGYDQSTVAAWRGEVLEAAGRTEDAAEAYRTALAALSSRRRPLSPALAEQSILLARRLDSLVEHSVETDP